MWGWVSLCYGWLLVPPCRIFRDSFPGSALAASDILQCDNQKCLQTLALGWQIALYGEPLL